MLDKLYGFFVNKFSDLFPIAGGTVGMITQTEKLQQSFVPTWEVVIGTAIIAMVGAVIGYLVKLIFDIITTDIRKKYNIK